MVQTIAHHLDQTLEAMAAQVFVISPTARQVTVKTRPETHLADILTEACEKLRLDPSKYGLKCVDKAIAYRSLAKGAANIGQEQQPRPRPLECHEVLRPIAWR